MKPKNKTTKSNNMSETLKTLASYLGCIGIAFIVMYYLNGTAGVLLVIALCCAFFVSVGVALLVMRSVRIELKLDKQAVAKGETMICAISLSKDILIPTPMIEILVECTAQLSKETDICRVFLAGQETNTVKIPVTAKYSGAAQVNIKEAFISDYFGIFRFRLKKAVVNDSMKVSVYPNIPDVPVQTNFLKTAVLFSADDEEEETNETALGQTGQPGYDHREYYPGDPIKRINWKLSSKKDIYMIRLDEKLAGGGQVFFLDMPNLPENDSTLAVRDCVIEGMLAVFSMMVREGRETVFFFMKKNVWNKIEIRSMTDIYTLQQQLADFTSCSIKNIVPPEMLSMGKTPICFTAAVSDAPQSAARIVSEIPDVLLLCAASSNLPHMTSEMWTISEGFELKKQ